MTNKEYINKNNEILRLLNGTEGIKRATIELKERVSTLKIYLQSGKVETLDLVLADYHMVETTVYQLLAKLELVVAEDVNTNQDVTAEVIEKLSKLIDLKKQIVADLDSFETEDLQKLIEVNSKISKLEKKLGGNLNE